MGAQRDWPTRTLIVLTLRVLPVVFDDVNVPTPSSASVPGKRVVFSGETFLPHGVQSQVMKSLHCLLCCLVAQAYASRAEATTFLRSGTDVVRAASTDYLEIVAQSSSAEYAQRYLYELYGFFLHSFLTVTSNCCLPDSMDGTTPLAPPVVSAALLFRSLRKTAKLVVENDFVAKSEKLQ